MEARNTPYRIGFEDLADDDLEFWTATYRIGFEDLSDDDLEFWTATALLDVDPEDVDPEDE